METVLGFFWVSTHTCKPALWLWRMRRIPRLDRKSTGGLRPSPYSVFLHESCRYPNTPGTNSRGLNAATVVRTANVTGFAISYAPSMASRIPSPCSSWCRKMFSCSIDPKLQRQDRDVVLVARSGSSQHVWVVRRSLSEIINGRLRRRSDARPQVARRRAQPL